MRKIWLFSILSLFIFCTISVFAESSSLRIHFIDVGEGNSILIQTPNGEAILVDAGNLITGFRVVEYLKKNNIDNLDYFILTHPHLDHIGGAFFVLQMIDVERIYDNGEDLTELSKSSDVYRWYEELARDSSVYGVLKAGDGFLLDDVIFKVIWPYETLAFSDFNANSLVIMIEYENFRCLLTGDLISMAEKELLEKTKDLNVDVLMVGHHGSDDASSEEFLNVLLPRISIISTNKDNIRGYPSAQVLTRLREINSRIYRTDSHGNIVASINSNGEVVIRTQR